MSTGPRHEARERALSLLYEAEAKGQPVRDVIADLPLAPDPFAVELASGVEDDGGRLDDVIATHAVGWAVDRMPVLDRMILRMAVFELRSRPDIPTAVAISEAVELAKAYSTEDSGRFVNGVLGAIAAEIRPDGPPAGGSLRS
jgi:N utilization substance protein B